MAGSVLGVIVAPSCANSQQKISKHSGSLQVASQKARYLKIKEHLKKPGVAVAYVDGLVCPSCAIGIRKHATNLAFIDSSAPSQGIKLDVDHQLVVLTLKKGRSIDRAGFADAVRKAGYKPIEFYHMKPAPNGKKYVSAKALNNQ